jgi:vancomycin permeability regulator SanA
MQLNILNSSIGQRPNRFTFLSRGLSLFFGSFLLLGIFERSVSGSDATEWFLTWLGLGGIWTDLLIGSAGTALMLYAIRPRMSEWRARSTISAIAFLMSLTIANAAGFWMLLSQEKIFPAVPVPLSLVFTAMLMAVLLGACKNSDSEEIRASREWGKISLVVAAAVFIFPILQMLFFGKTDYRRRADAAVVFGARVYADGRLSDALSERVRTACELYRQGLVKKLIFSGGPGEGRVHEAEAMKTLALSLGVKEADILLDFAGVNTETTVRNTAVIAARHNFNRILAVSHFYHLPRVKTAFEKQHLTAYTVPAYEPQLLAKLPLFMTREVAAWWVYYLRGPQEA